MVLVVAFVVFVFVVVIASLAVAVPGVPVCLAPRQLPTQAVRSGLMSQDHNDDGDDDEVDDGDDDDSMRFIMMEMIMMVTGRMLQLKVMMMTI